MVRSGYERLWMGKMAEGGMMRTGYERLWMGKNGRGWDGAHWV